MKTLNLRILPLSHVSIIILFSFYSCFDKTITNLTEEEINKLIPEEAYNISKKISREPNIITISLMLDQQYPASEIINFYNRILIHLGYKEFNNSYIDMKTDTWEYYQDNTKKNNPIVFQYMNLWHSDDKKLCILVLLRYYDYKQDIKKLRCEAQANPQNNKLKIIIQIMPESIFRLKPIDEKSKF